MEPPPPTVGGSTATMGIGHLGASPTPCRSGGAPSSNWDPAAPPPHRPGIRWHPLPIALLIRWRPLPIPIVSCAPSFGARSAGSNTAATHVSPFSRLFSSASAAVAIVPHDGRDSGLGGSAYWAWIRAGTESAPAPAPPQEEEDEGPALYIPVKAYFLSTSIDLKSMQAEHGNDIVPPPTCSLNYIALRYSEFPPEIIFHYGSAVLFSIADHEAEYCLDIIRKHALGWLPETRKDDYAVVEKPSLTTWMKGGLDYIVLKKFGHGWDLHNFKRSWSKYRP
ncbi:unnamed protein product [Miscanthus lutarioriparius]|uniref:Uncharacterized protein n=1 Tax=Miscanthus lutarioriparius TaxID=422564 RepID=A0A811NEI4_9POAL|nr:unnamed protein product [Miscanthus lutarioriparius]